MALTVSNVNSLSLLSILNKTSTNQSNVMNRLSTGSRINRGADDPAGLIAMRGVDLELKSVDAAISNNQRTDAMLGVADKALGEIASMLQDVQTLVQKSANSSGLSASEVAANQSQIDNALAAIDRIVGTTEFNGKKLLDGSLGINATATASKITDIQVHSRNPNTTISTLEVQVTDSATQATHALATTSSSNATTLQVSGKLGSTTIELAAGADLSAVADMINDAAAATGVTASMESGTLNLYGGFGSSSFVRVEALAGGDNYTTTSGTKGTDADVNVNGLDVAVDGLNVNVSGSGLNMSFTITEDFNNDGASSTQNITLDTNSGATFQLGSDASTRATIGLASVYSQRLGSSVEGYLSELKSGGAASLISDPSKASKIVAEASAQISRIQGRLGGFQKFQVNTALNALSATKEGLTSARSTIADVDYATETAELNKQNVLMQSAMSLLGLANQQSSQILSLLR